MATVELVSQHNMKYTVKLKNSYNYSIHTHALFYKNTVQMKTTVNYMLITGGKKTEKSAHLLP